MVFLIYLYLIVKPAPVGRKSNLVEGISSVLLGWEKGREERHCFLDQGEK